MLYGEMLFPRRTARTTPSTEPVLAPLAVPRVSRLLYDCIAFVSINVIHESEGLMFVVSGYRHTAEAVRVVHEVSNHRP